MGYIDKAVNWAISIANDSSHGYDQTYREGPNYDCSSLVINAYTNAGINVKGAGAIYTGNMRSAFIKCGFKDVTSSCNLSTTSGMKRGDVLLNEVHHTAIYLGDGQIVQASINELGTVRGGESGDQTGKEIWVRDYYNYPWDCVLRYPEASTASDTKTTLSVKNTISVPSGLGKCYTYETWNREEHGMSAWRADSTQKKLITTAKNRNDYSFDSDGYGRIGERWVVAMTSTFGEVGDYVDIYCADGTVYKSVIGDEKNQNDVGCTKYGHDGGQTIIEFMTNWPAEPLHENRKGNGGVIKVLNYGSYFDYPDYAADGTVSTDEVSEEIEEPQKKEITGQQNVANYGAQMAERLNAFEGRKSSEDSTPEIELYIINYAGEIFKPILKDTIEWETTYSGAPAQLSFTVIKDETISFLEGSQVIFKYKSVPLFYGFVFKKTRDKEQHIKCVAYD